MSKYSYIIEDNTVKAVGQENIEVYDIECLDLKSLNYYKTLLAHERDLEYAKEYLNQMFFHEGTTLIDGALINSAIQLLTKCFSNPENKGRGQLNENKVFRKFAKEIGEQDLTAQFQQIRDARNQVIAHDQLDFKGNIIGLAVNKNSREAEDIATFAIRTQYLYQKNQQLLLRMIDITMKFVDSQIKEQEKMILNAYNSLEVKPELQPIECKSIPLAKCW